MTRCPSGYYCEGGTSNYLASPCPAGRWSRKQQLTASGECDACPEGHYCPGDGGTPIMCPKGTYRSSTGAECAYADSGSSCCTTCPGGSKCPYLGMTAAIDCGAGSYSPDGSQECYTCGAGYLCDAVNGVSLDTYWGSPCLGTSCEVWSDGEYRTDDCPLGHYCPSSSRHAIPCPIGTVRDTVGATSLSDCEAVTTAHDTTNGGSNALYVDTPGSYSAII